MKIHQVSDLHLEWGPCELPGGDILILAGDTIEIRNIEKKESFIDFFEELKKYREVLYIFGNHEYYYGDINESIDSFKEFLQEYKISNVTVLEDSYKIIDDVIFIGATLWSDFYKDNPCVKWSASRRMNDFKLVECAHFPFNPDLALEKHNFSKNYIEKIVKENSEKDVVLITHHAPSYRSISREYVNDDLNGAYASDCEYLFYENENIKLAFHGHIHSSSDYMINKTRVLCNPRGYVGHGENSEFICPMEIEL